MSGTAEKILADALRLPESDRADLVDKLVESLDADDGADTLHPEWEAEIARRVADMDSGRVTPIPWPEALRIILSNDETADS
jgi:putative addiction module component (TIGR02574 family)